MAFLMPIFNPDLYNHTSVATIIDFDNACIEWRQYTHSPAAQTKRFSYDEKWYYFFRGFVIPFCICVSSDVHIDWFKGNDFYIQYIPI